MFAGLVAHVNHVLGHGFCRLVPADALPLVAGLFAHALHGVLIAVRVIQRLHARNALRADAPLRHRVDGIALQLDYATVAHRGDNAAVRDAGAARRANLLHVVVGPCFVARREIVRGLNAKRACAGRDGRRLHKRATRHSRRQS